MTHDDDLTPDEQRLFERFFSRTMEFPEEFKSWVPQQVGNHDL